MKKILISLCLLFVLFIPVQVHAAEPVTITSTLISGDKIFVRTSGITHTDDGTYSLYMQEPYQVGTSGTNLVTSKAGKQNVFIVDLKNGASTNVYNKFVVMGKVKGKLTALSAPGYVTNPQALATTTVKRKDNGKKGILLSCQYLPDRETLRELDLDQGVYNVMLGKLCHNGTIPYEFEGKTYYFNEEHLSQYDFVVESMKELGIQGTLILLNDKTPDNTMIHPLSRSGVGHYYAFNTAEKAGTEQLAAVVSFLAERYSGRDRGTIDNYIIGNEVNSRNWNWMSKDVSMEDYVKEYEKAFRICYASIKRHNPNARVYISLDNNWEVSYGNTMPAKEICDYFASGIREEGDIHWGMAMHPYNHPLTKVDTWTNSSTTTKDITMQNLDILVDYMSTAKLLDTRGERRSIILSEQGYTSTTAGEEQQGIAIVYGYMKACENDAIDGYLLTRQQDDLSEMAQNMYFGIQNVDGTRKASFDWYKMADDAAIQNIVKQKTGYQ